MKKSFLRYRTFFFKFLPTQKSKTKQTYPPLIKSKKKVNWLVENCGSIKHLKKMCQFLN